MRALDANSMKPLVAALVQKLQLEGVQINLIWETIEGQMGFCHPRGNKVYDIRMSELADDVESCIILAHELKHVQQIEQRRLVPVSGKFGSGYFWLGKEYTWKDVPYNERPHEIEADRFSRTGLQMAANMKVLNFN